MEKDLEFLRLWDMYSPMLTCAQREITDLYFNYDLSLAEIAEQKGISRQSVSCCLQTSRNRLEKYEEKLGFLKTLTDLSREYSAYMTVCQRFIESQPQTPEIEDFKNQIKKVHEEFDSEVIVIDHKDEE